MGLLDKLKRRLTKSAARPAHMRTAEQWNEQFKSGRWDYLEKNIEELGHYSIITSYYQQFTPQGSVLDVGCGQGVLNRHLRLHQYSNYLGIDISAEAIRLAGKYQDDKTQFVAANVEEYLPESKYDCIIFNECLYYLNDPMATVRRYSRLLGDSGYMIISMFGDDEPIQKIWRQLDGQYQISDKIQVRHVPSGLYWNIAAYSRNILMRQL